MANIQRGEQRQYIEHVPDTPADFGAAVQSVGQVFDAGVKIFQQEKQTDLANKQIDLHAKFMQKNNEINLKYQADPTNPEIDKERKQAFDNLVSQYQISPLVQKQWKETTDNIYNRYKLYNAEWSMKQAQTNAQTNLENGYKTLIDNAGMQAQQNPDDVSAIRMTAVNGLEALRTGSVGQLGEVVVNNALKSATHDIAVSMLSGMTMNDPLKAEKLLKDKSFRNDVGDVKTLEQLDNYVQSAVVNHHKKVAVADMCNSLRKMNSEQAHKILDGNASVMEVMNFVNDKNMPKATKELITGMYGIGSKTDYVFNMDTCKVEKKKESSGGSGSSSGRVLGLESLRKISKEAKGQIADNLESSLGSLITLSEPEEIKPKRIAKKYGQAHQSIVMDKLQSLIAHQGAMDMAQQAGILTRQQRNGLMNRYVMPFADYLEKNLAGLDEKQGFFGTKLGYDRIKNAPEFNIEGLRKDSVQAKQMTRNKLNAQIHYFRSLDEARRQYGLNSIYDLENLPKAEQEKIYSNASDNAIKMAKKYSNKPEFFFQRDYPQFYKMGIEMFGIKDGRDIARQVAKKVYNAPDDKPLNVAEEMGKAINMKYQLKVNESMRTVLNAYENKLPNRKQNNPYNMNTRLGREMYQGDKALQKRMSDYNNSIVQRMKKLGVSKADVQDTVNKTGLTESQVLSLLEIQKNNVSMSDLYD